MNCGKAAREATLECPILQYNVIFTFILNSPFSILHYVNRKINLLNHWAFSPIMRFERGLPMKNKRMRYISITAAILLVFVLLMLLFSNRSRFQRNGSAGRRTGCNISGLFVGGI